MARVILETQLAGLTAQFFQAGEAVDRMLSIGLEALPARLLVQLSLMGSEKNRPGELEEAQVLRQKLRTRWMEVTDVSVITDLFALGQETRDLWWASLQALSTGNVAAAHQVQQEDDVVDVRYHMLRHDLFTLLSGTARSVLSFPDACQMQRWTLLLEIAHSLERVGDHGVAICERVIFVEEGILRTAISPGDAVEDARVSRTTNVLWSKKMERLCASLWALIALRNIRRLDNSVSCTRRYNQV
ncbi:PhoU domain-containing protein [Ktedonobacteria bacterium brp13]|nr:PhoU domain-containing protein [Ktedonobacteria bacterium brp13]